MRIFFNKVGAFSEQLSQQKVHQLGTGSGGTLNLNSSFEAQKKPDVGCVICGVTFIIFPDIQYPASQILHDTSS
jgi:hypothetical protein